MVTLAGPCGRLKKSQKTSNSHGKPQITALATIHRNPARENYLPFSSPAVASPCSPLVISKLRPSTVTYLQLGSGAKHERRYEQTKFAPEWHFLQGSGSTLFTRGPLFK